MRSQSRVKFLTGNRHKVEEAHIILSEYGIELEMLDAKTVEIQHSDLREIAVYSLKDALSRGHSPPMLVEDSGFFVTALNDFPGPFSSYVYDAVGAKGILKLMVDIEDRRARFSSAVVFALNRSTFKIFEGQVEGFIAESAAGVSGFGFDPIFIPKGEMRTFSQMTIQEKNLFSHRARAFMSFAQWYSKELR